MDKTCSCGHMKDNPLVSAKTKYGRWGWLLLSIGISPKPVEIIYQCQKCGEIVETSKDPVLLEKYRYNSDITK
ncbi:MAG: hypothetical protein ABSF32_04585 [Ignavibacteria bacterium]